MNTQPIAPVADRWPDSTPAGASDLETLVALSRLLGADPQLVLWGGGNTSLKTVEIDYRGRQTSVLRIKGSGSDLKTSTARDYPGVRMDDILPLFERAEMRDEAMTEYLAHALLDPTSPRPSIETLLHGFIPARCVVHSHADAILALTNNDRADRILAEVFGPEVILIPYRLPGFVLAKEVWLAVRDNPAARAVLLLNHGLITWDDDPRAAYKQHIELVNRAAAYVARHTASGPVLGTPTYPIPAPEFRRAIAAQIGPLLRGLLGGEQRVVTRFDDSQDVLRLVSAAGARDLIAHGAATPDHILHIKRTPAWIESADLNDPASVTAAVREGVARYQEEYRAYHAAHQTEQALLPPIPRVVLVRGVGMFSVGKDSKALDIAQDVYHHTIAILEGAEATGRYRSLSQAHAFEAEYWPLELYKLTLAPPERELSRRVVLITGAAGAIGAGIARRFAAAGAHVVCADINLAGVEALVADLTAAHPSNRGLAAVMDVTSQDSVRAAFQDMLLAFGGVDIVVPNAGIAHGAPLDDLSLEDWQRSFAINTTGHFLVASEGLRIMKQQGTGGSFVFIATKNVTAPGKDFGAYSASKAAQAQLARVLALEGGAFGIRSNMLNPDAIFANSGLWSPEVREERAKSYGIAPQDLEEFYRKRNILRANVTAEDVAEAALFYASDRSAKTTGSMLPVDGGLREAFPR
ncbi:MAG TPA: bifunctional rhamnulose-1-phosphate aldolase/short-chain dehydrogenase [Chloroflexota bacterium]|nr:bifunctional rhamnulose-1-phosphate aldolase/short-chain dehydrogenase [Chloroflexota bacterium]